MSMKRLDPSKPEDLKRLIETGLIWNGAVPLEYKDMAIDAIAEGRIEAPDNLPAGTLAHINDLRNAMGSAPLEVGPTPDGGEPSA